VNARASIVGRLPPASGVSGGAATVQAEAKSRRRIHLGAWTDVPVFEFGALAAGQDIAGPAIIESDTTTVLLRGGDTARFDVRGWLDLTVG
jgi:N-methylhydantoinase A